MRNTKSSLSRADAGGDQKQDYYLEWPKDKHIRKGGFRGGVPGVLKHPPSRFIAPLS